jgi:hypothetical protein
VIMTCRAAKAKLGPFSLANLFWRPGAACTSRDRRPFEDRYPRHLGDANVERHGAEVVQDVSWHSQRAAGCSPR